MTHRDSPDYSKKHLPGEEVNKAIVLALSEAAESGTISCAAVFKVVSEHGVSPAEAGKTIDRLDIKLVKCQLGLFGYLPGRVIVKPADKVSTELEVAIRNNLVSGRLSCAQAWSIAEEFKIRRMDVSAAAEALHIKIKPCQLGAF